MQHLMIDLETMGTAFDAPILAIGAVYFDPDTGKMGDKFYEAIDIADAFRYGRASGDTVRFWMGQGDEARKACVSGNKKAAAVFTAFETFCLKHGSNVRPWGNGASFDISILDYAFPRVLKKGSPWKFWNVLDCRTVKEMAKGKVDFTRERKGPAHHALYDAIHQAEWVSHYWQGLRQTPVKVLETEDVDLLA